MGKGLVSFHDSQPKAKVLQRTQTGRASSGTSDFHVWRVRHALTQGDAAELLGVNPSTAQRWDAYPEKAPAVLEHALGLHDLLRAEVAAYRHALDAHELLALRECGRITTIDGLVMKLRHDSTVAAMVENLAGTTSPARKAAILYGIKHGLF